MQVTSTGRVRRSPDEWRDLISKFHLSGLVPREFCRKQKVSLTSFQRWQSRLAPPTQEAEERSRESQTGRRGVPEYG